MDNTELKTFAKLVEEMRKAQTQYFDARKMRLDTVANDWWRKARKLEAQVDKRTAEILAGATPGKLF